MSKQILYGEHSPVDDDLWDSQIVQHHAPTRARAQHMKRILDHLRKLARHDSCICDHIVGLHMVIWNVLHVRNFMLSHHEIWEQVLKVCKNCPYMTTRKTMNPTWMGGSSFSFNWFGFCYASCACKQCG